jgi:hypothetical protein
MNRLCKLIIVISILVTINDTSFGQGIGCTNAESLISCERPLLFVDNETHGLHGAVVGSDPLMIKIDVTSNSTSLLSITVPLNHQNIFEYLGNLVLQGPSSSSVDLAVYRLKPLNYNSSTGQEIIFNVEAISNSIGYLTQSNIYSPIAKFGSLSSYFKDCGSCSSCFTRYEIINTYENLVIEVCDKFFNTSAITIFEFGQLNSNNQVAMSQFMSWMGGFQGSFQPLYSHWLPLLNPTNLGKTYIENDPGFCNFDESLFCPCLLDLYNYFSLINEKIKGNIPNTLNTSMENEILQHMINACSCSGQYCLIFENTVNSNSEEVKIKLLPVHQNNLPALILNIYLKDKNTSPIKFSTIGYSYNFTQDINILNGDPKLIQSNSVSFNNTTNSFDFINGFSVFDINAIGAISNEACTPDLPCESCITSFSPIPGENYRLYAWVKEDGSAAGKTSYTYPSIEITFTGPSPMQSFLPSGNIIDGWQRIEGQFQVPLGSSKFALELKSVGGTSFFDDIRITPVKSSSKSYVFDPVTLKLSAILDEQNYASFYEYDDEGNLVRVKKETERGIMTIKESRKGSKKQ